MKYMLMMNAKRGKGDWEVIAWPPEDLKAHIGFVKRFNKQLRDAGELVAAEGLAAPGQARVVGARKDGTPEVTDGPFAEAKEFLAGRSPASARDGRQLRGRDRSLPGRVARTTSIPERDYLTTQAARLSVERK